MGTQIDKSHISLLFGCKNHAKSENENLKLLLKSYVNNKNQERSEAIRQKKFEAEYGGLNLIQIEYKLNSVQKT